MTPRKPWSYRQLLAALLPAVGVTASIALPLMAQTAQIGDQIRNTFTGTFQDDAGKELTATSNEVVLVVSEVAGLTVQSGAPTKANPDPNDMLTVDFVITNVGNDPTQVFIPGQAVLSDPPGKTGSASFTQGTLQILEFNGAALPTPINVPTNGEISGNAALGLPNGGALNPGQTIKVRAKLTVKDIALKNDSVLISLGNTGTTANQQNILYANDPGSVYTVNIPDGGATGEAAGNPVNGQREAMDGVQIVVGARLQAFDTILLARDYNSGNTPGVLSDDRITYNLTARVERTAPVGILDVVPTPLCPTSIKLEGAAVDRVLVSDAIPAGTILSNVAPIASTEGVWATVYTISSLTIPANEAQWTATRPANDQVTRIGFLRDNCIPTGTIAPGFSFVVEPKPDFTGGRIVNLAQIFGQSTVGPVVPGTTTQIVYDESGDQDPNNGLGATNPDPKSGGIAEDLGGIMARPGDLALDGVDPGRGTSPGATDTNQGVNTGTTAGSKGAGGEVIAQTIAVAPANGPQDQPGAVGQKNTEDDFTNVILAPPAAIPATQKLDDAQTPPVVFTNTVRNSSAIAQDISIIPQTPDLKDALPDGTKVTITNPANGQTATYSYTAAGGFVFVSGNGTTAAQPIVLATGPNAVANYTVTLDLPNAEQVKEYPVPLLAYVDQGTAGYDAGDPSNLTIDRLYTGMIRVVKEARVLEDDGVKELVPFTTDTAKLAQAAEPNRFVEYRLTYTNVSAGGGTNSVILPATDFTIIDDGALAPNNWFSTTLDPAFPTASNGTATSSFGVITVTAANGDIQAYQLKVPTLNPGETGTLTFRRKIRQP